VAGARSHALVLLSRLKGIHPEVGETLLRPGEPLFEYWGHEACWMPMELYPHFAFRRRGMARSDWCREILDADRSLTRSILRRIRDEGPIRSADLDGESHGPWWGYKTAKRVVVALWSSGRLAVRERRSFQRSFDIAERVIPDDVRALRVDRRAAFRELLLLALHGHGWAQTGTLAATWRLRNLKQELESALDDLREDGRIVVCDFQREDGTRRRGWIRPEDLEQTDDLRRMRPRGDRGVLLSPFDPVLWDRARVKDLFGFDQVLEVFKPAPQRKYGYFCLPVLAGDQLVARVDLKADRGQGKLRILSRRHEESRHSPGPHRSRETTREATDHALERFRHALGLDLS